MNFEATQTVTETHVQTNIRWDPGYIKTIPGALKLGAVVRIYLYLCFYVMFVFTGLQDQFDCYF